MLGHATIDVHVMSWQVSWQVCALSVPWGHWLHPCTIRLYMGGGGASAPSPSACCLTSKTYGATGLFRV